MTHAARQTTPIGIDIGRSAVKVAITVQGAPVHLQYPSVVIPAFPISDAASARAAERDTVMVGSQRYATVPAVVGAAV